MLKQLKRKFENFLLDKIKQVILSDNDVQNKKIKNSLEISFHV